MSTDFAMHDRAVCLAPGLFRSLNKKQKRGNLDITYNFGPREYLRFTGFQQLGVDDMRFYQVISALTRTEGNKVHSETSLPGSVIVRDKLQLILESRSADTMLLKTTYYQILNMLDYEDSGTNRKLLEASLTRLSGVVTHVSRADGAKAGGFTLLSYYLNPEDGLVWIGINPFLTESILGTRHYTRIELSEVRALAHMGENSDQASLIHQHLCPWIDGGKYGKVSLETLCWYVWPEEAPSRNAMNIRRTRARKAVLLLGNLEGWRVEEVKKDVWCIERPKFLVSRIG